MPLVAVLVAAPSPLAGEGMHIVGDELAWVRGLSPRVGSRIETLIRRFAPPSPTSAFA